MCLLILTGSNSNTKLRITTAKALTSAKAALARQFPEHETVRAMYGVGETGAVQLMAEIGDVRRFSKRSSIVSFAGVDPAVDESGKHVSRSKPTTKRGSPHLRRTLYLSSQSSSLTSRCTSSCVSIAPV